MKITNFLPADIKLNPKQLELAEILEYTIDQLIEKKLFKFFNNNPTKKGIYLYGGVGSGKTMLMRAFYNALPISSKQLVHYQSFMLDIHKNIHQLQATSTGRVLSKLARAYVNKAQIICIDELEIKDITDAMIISKLFEELINGSFVFITSNVEPENIYKDGIQREAVLPFIKLVKESFQVLSLATEQDYRLVKILSTNDTLFYPLVEESVSKIENIISTLTNNMLSPFSIKVFGRRIEFSSVYQTVLVTDFEELCGRDRGYSDYVTICQHFKTIIVKNVPIIPADNTDLAIRFINFVDNAYFYKVLLFMSLEASPAEIYKGHRRGQEFQRTVSRLHEMNGNF